MTVARRDRYYCSARREKAMVWLTDRADFPGFNAVYSGYFPHEQPARSAVVNDLLVDVRVEVEVVAWRPSG